MAKTTIHGIDLTASDGIDQLFAFHRITFGDAVMEENGGGGGEGDGSGDGEGEGTAGAAGEGTGGEGDGSGGTNDGEGENALGDAGKKALDSMKAQLKAAKAEKAAATAELKALKDAADLANKKPEEQELAKARKEAAQEATEKANERILRADIKAAAAGKLKNPAIAVKLLDLSVFETDGDGNFDQSEIEDAIGELLKADPYLAAQGGTVQFDSGRGKQAPAGQLTKEQLDKLSPAETMKALREGRLKSLLKK
ncbi:MAG: hypothetical protein M3Y33_21635 [Actinomycetota bacterium]|nr:hypothetical protein [Actinomycetota bacterium]